MGAMRVTAVHFLQKAKVIELLKYLAGDEDLVDRQEAVQIPGGNYKLSGVGPPCAVEDTHLGCYSLLNQRGYSNYT